MGVYTRNGIVTNGLIAHYDAANSLSYNSGSGTWKDLSGKIASCYMYNRSLSASEQLQNYTALKARFGL